MTTLANAPANSNLQASALGGDKNAQRRGLWILHDDSSQLVKSEAYECTQLAVAARRLGMRCDIISTRRLHVLITADHGARLLLNGQPVTLPSLVIPRNGAHTTYREFTILRHLERQGVPCVNSAASIQAAADKFRAHAILAGHVPVPQTLLVDKSTDLDLVEREIGFPIVAKLLSGTQGAGVMPIHSKSALRDLRDMMANSGQAANMLVQRLVAGSAGRDLRVLVVGGRAVACMLRQASNGELKANFSQGGTVQRHVISPQIERMATDTCDLLGLRIAGVDLLFDGDGYCVCEANASPGWQGLETCHGDIDIAMTLLEYLLSGTGLVPPAPVAPLGDAGNV